MDTLTRLDLLPNKTYYYICLESYRGKPLFIQTRKPTIKTITTHSITPAERYNSTYYHTSDVGVENLNGYYISDAKGNRSWKWQGIFTGKVTRALREEDSSLFKDRLKEDFKTYSSFLRNTNNKQFWIFESKQEALENIENFLLEGLEFMERTLRTLEICLKKTEKPTIEFNPILEKQEGLVMRKNPGDKIWIFLHDLTIRTWWGSDKENYCRIANIPPIQMEVETIDTERRILHIKDIDRNIYLYQNNYRGGNSFFYWAGDEADANNLYNYLKYDNLRDGIRRIKINIDTYKYWLSDIEKRKSLDLVL